MTRSLRWWTMLLLLLFMVVWCLRQQQKVLGIYYFWQHKLDTKHTQTLPTKHSRDQHDMTNMQIKYAHKPQVEKVSSFLAESTVTSESTNTCAVKYQNNYTLTISKKNTETETIVRGTIGLKISVIIFGLVVVFCQFVRF